MMDEIAKRLTKARKAAGYSTKKAAAEAMGIKYPTYAGHENGNDGFTFEQATFYARKFRVTLDWLIAGKGNGPSGEKDAAWEIYVEAASMAPHELELLKGQIDFIKKTRAR